jgi:hypothetical protein
VNFVTSKFAPPVEPSSGAMTGARVSEMTVPSFGATL